MSHMAVANEEPLGKQIFLPPELKKRMSDLALSLNDGKRAFDATLWVVAGALVSGLDRDMLLDAVRSVKHHFQDGGDVESAACGLAELFQIKQAVRCKEQTSDDGGRPAARRMMLVVRSTVRQRNRTKKKQVNR